MKRCQKQIGGNDCGMSAVANAVALLRGVDPATVKLTSLHIIIFSFIYLFLIHMDMYKDY